MSNTTALKLGTNHIYSGFNQQALPQVGDGATILGWTDRRAATVVSFERNAKGTKNRVGIVEDNAKRTDSNGLSELQTYEFSPGTGSPSYFTLRKNGKWVREGESINGGQRIIIGKRDHYYDFSF